jgi:hypothetical protein
MPPFLSILGVAGLLGLLAGAPGRAGAAWTWDRGPHHLALLGEGRVVWRYEAVPTVGKPHFHPLGPVGGPVLTGLAPPDHPWHYGLWFSWKFINEVNFWEEDRRTGRASGTTRAADPVFQTRPDGEARLTQEVDYVLPDGTTALEERRVIRVCPPQPEGGYSLDWDAIFTALQPVTLDRTPLAGEPGGQAWGGYAGLSLRLSTGLVSRVTAADVPLPAWRQDRVRVPGRAFDYAGRVDGRPAGVAILDHPDNPGSPVTWYAIQSREMSFFTPALLAPQPRRMAAGETLRLRYRLWVHPGAWSSVELTARLVDYRAGAHAPAPTPPSETSP